LTLLRRFLAIFFIALVAVLGQWGSAFAQTESAGAQSLTFNHDTTGFLLDSTHKQVQCESCHTAGTFRGTPRDCATCHAGPGSRAPGKPATHIPSNNLKCDSCHTTTRWSPARMNHGLVPQMSCKTCHNGVNAEGKPVNGVHPSSSADLLYISY
jgi:hypothetical protein